MPLPARRVDWVWTHSPAALNASLVTNAAPLIASGGLAVLFLGDEPHVGSEANLARVANAARASLNSIDGGSSVLIYMNHCGSGLKRYNITKILGAIDVISLDGYCVYDLSVPKCDPSKEAGMMRGIYERGLLPMMHPNQSLFVVPYALRHSLPSSLPCVLASLLPSFLASFLLSLQTRDCSSCSALLDDGAWHVLFARRGMFNAGNLSGHSLAEQQAAMAEKLRGYATWADEEPRLIGIFPWHLEDFACAMGARGADGQAPQYCLGATHFPEAMGVVREIGQNLSRPERFGTSL